MHTREAGLAVAALVLPLMVGCSATGAAMTGGQMAWNLSKETTYLRVRLDGQEGKENPLKKAASGWSGWKISDPVSTSPKLEYRITKPEKMGRITVVTVAIHQEFEADFSHQADFTIVARDTNNPDAQMKPDTEYDLSNPGQGFKILDVRGNEVPKVDMKPGMRYQVVLTVRADRSQTAVVEFRTK